MSLKLLKLTVITPLMVSTIWINEKSYATQSQTPQTKPPLTKTPNLSNLKGAVQQKPTTGVSSPLLGSKEKLTENMNWLKEGLDQEAIERISEKGEGRYYITAGGAVGAYTDTVVKYLSKVPVGSFVALGTGGVDVQATTTSAINIIGSSIAQALKVYGRYKVASVLQVMSSHEQIVEAAQQSYEKIQQLNDIIKDLLGYRKKDIVINSAEDVFSKKLIKNIQLLTDRLHVTDFKSKIGDQLEVTLKDLKIEKDKFNNYVKLLQIKALDYELMALHKRVHKEAYIKAMKENLEILKAAISQLNGSINEIQEQINKKQGNGDKLMSLENKLIAEQGSLKDQYAALDSEYHFYMDLPEESPDKLEKERNEILEKTEEFKDSLSSGESFDSEDRLAVLEKRIAQLEKRAVPKS